MWKGDSYSGLLLILLTWYSFLVCWICVWRHVKESKIPLLGIKMKSQFGERFWNLNGFGGGLWDPFYPKLGLFNLRSTLLPSVCSIITYRWQKKRNAKADLCSATGCCNLILFGLFAWSSIKEEGICFCRVYVFFDDYLSMCWAVDENFSKFRISFWQR
jgi:hypothetical protein